MAVLSLSTNCCRVCNAEKPIGEFYVVKGRGGKYADNTCKVCRIAKNNGRSVSPERAEELRQYRKQYKARQRRAKGCRLRSDMAAEASARQTAIAQKREIPAQRQHDAHVKHWRGVIRSREYYRANCLDPDFRLRVAARKRDRLKRSPEARAKAAAYMRKWLKTPQGKASLAKAKSSPKAIAARREAWSRRVSTPKGNLDQRMSKAIRDSLKGKKNGSSWQALVGYTLDELQRHLERQFQKGMGWHNRNEWHIDHIVPKSAFVYETPDDEEFKACWALTNLRPLWAKENIHKSSARLHLL